jgi:hypothetical protein
LKPASLFSFAKEPFLRLKKRTIRAIRVDNKKGLNYTVAYLLNK